MPLKPSEQEEEHFARMEYERKKKIEEEKHKTLAAGERKRLQEIHYMRCPKCGMELIEIGYKGIKIDRCSECEGYGLMLENSKQCRSLRNQGLINCSACLRSNVRSNKPI